MADITVQNLTKYYGDRLILKDISFDIQPGEKVAILGANGAGKSTLFGAIGGNFLTDSGKILLDGQNVTFWPEHRRSKVIGRLFQNPMRGSAPGMAIEENLALAAGRGGWLGQIRRRDREYFREQLRELDMGLEDRLRQPVGLLSGGQRQRVAIARSLCMEPEFLVADEPIASLDVSIQAQILNLMQDLQKRYGLTYVFISHNLSVVEHLCDRIAVMYLGNIVEIANKRNLFDNPKHPYTKALLDAIPIPNPDRKTMKGVLKGDVPSPLNPPKGCCFHTRCEYATEECYQIKPQLAEVESGHFVACCHAK